MRQSVSTRLSVLVGVTGATAVLLGAFGAHALRNVLDVKGLEIWHTAVTYHAWHALALALAVALGGGQRRLVAIAAFVVGIALFSGSLYALALGAPRWTGIITPFGGLAFITGWIAFGLSLSPGND